MHHATDDTCDNLFENQISLIGSTDMHTSSGDNIDSRVAERELIDNLVDIATSGRIPTTKEEAAACRLAAMLLIYRKPSISESLRDAVEKSADGNQVANFSIEYLLSLPGVLGISRFSDNINKAFNGIRI